MPFDLLSTPTQIRTQLGRLVKASERIDVFVPALADPALIELLADAAERGAEVNVTTNLDTTTTTDAVARLHASGASMGVFEPATFRRRKVRRFKPGVILFDNEAEWWSAALVGSFSGTTESLAQDLEIITLVETTEFSEGTPDGDYLCALLDWADDVRHKPIDDAMAAAHRAACAPKKPETKKPARSARVVEMKPDAVGYSSPLSWQEIGRCDWGTYWNALLEADQLRGPRMKDSLCGANGWLAAIEAAHHAYLAGPEAWRDPQVRDALLGRTKPTRLLGRIEGTGFADRLEEDAEFRRRLHATAERCLTDPSAVGLQDALTDLIEDEDVSVPDMSRLLTAAAPDRFVSILGRVVPMRVGNIVGFDLSTGASTLQNQLTRYVDAVQVIRTFPWAVEVSAERTSDHPREADAWAKRVALLGCLIC